MKTDVRRWVNEGHDITTSEEMKIVLPFREGVRGCRFAIVVIDKSIQKFTIEKDPRYQFPEQFFVL